MNNYVSWFFSIENTNPPCSVLCLSKFWSSTGFIQYHGTDTPQINAKLVKDQKGQTKDSRLAIFIENNMLWEPILTSRWTNESILCHKDSLLFASRHLTLRGGGGGTAGSQSPASRTPFSRLPYFFVPLSPHSHPSLCFSHYHFLKIMLFDSLFFVFTVRQ